MRTYFSIVCLYSHPPTTDWIGVIKRPRARCPLTSAYYVLLICFIFLGFVMCACSVSWRDVRRTYIKARMRLSMELCPPLAFEWHQRKNHESYIRGVIQRDSSRKGKPTQTHVQHARAAEVLTNTEVVVPRWAATTKKRARRRRRERQFGDSEPLMK